MMLRIIRIEVQFYPEILLKCTSLKRKKGVGQKQDYHSNLKCTSLQHSLLQSR